MEPGRTLRERYVIERELGRGEHGVVFAGRDHLLEREVAIKVVSTSDRRHPARPDLRRGAKRAAGLEHPSIVPVLDYGRDDELLFLVMPLSHGRALSELSSAGPLPIPIVAEIGRQVALALDHGHGRGVTHRNLKPGNILLSYEQDEGLKVELTDFGLSQAPGASRYAAPEQVAGEQPDSRSDLYSLGVVLYEAVVGQPPAGEASPAGDASPAGEASPADEASPARPGLLRSGVPAQLDTLILALLARQPVRRPAKASEVAELLEPYADATAAAAAELLGSNVRTRLVGLDGLDDGRATRLHDSVGRNRTLHMIESRLIAARSGHMQLILLEGAAGIGKTTILDELALICQQRELELLRTRATAPQGGSPSSWPNSWVEPFGELLNAGLAQRPEAIELLADRAASLVALFPNLAYNRLGHLAHKPAREASWAGLERVGGLTDDIGQIRARAAIGERDPRKAAHENAEGLLVRVFRALVASGRPLTLAIDDAHSSRETVELVDMLFRRLPHAPLMFVIAYEPGSFHASATLARLSRRLAQHPRAVVSTLEPLGEDVYNTLMVQMLGGGQPRPGLASSLWRESGGRPAYARALIRTAIEAGVLVQRDNIWRLDVARWPIPANVQAAMTASLRQLPSSLVVALRIGSVLAVPSGQFNFDEAVELCGRSRDELEHLFGRAIERGLVTEHRHSESIILRFTSELARRIIHAELPAIARTKFHIHCTARLPSSDDARVQYARIAHLLEADAVARVRPLVLARGQQARDEGKAEEVRAQLRELLAQADKLPAVEHAELLLLRAELDRVCGEPDQSVEALQRLVAMLDQNDEPRMSRLGERGAELAKEIGQRSLADRLLGLRPRDRRAAERQRRARAELAALRPATSSRSMQIGDLLFMHGEFTAAREAYDSARRRAAKDSDHEEEVRQLQNLVRVASSLGHYETALSYCREGFELLTGKRSLERVGLWAMAAHAHCEAGYYDRAVAELEAGEAELSTFPVQRSSDRDRVTAELERSRGHWHMGTGDPESAIRAYEAWLAMIPTTDRWNISVARLNLGRACAFGGYASRALRELERATADKRVLGDRHGLIRTQIARIRVLRDLGQIEEGGEILKEISELADEIEDPRLFAVVHNELARHALLSGRLELAAQEARRAKDVAQRIASSTELAASHELLASVSLARSERGEAEHHAAQAVAEATDNKLDGALISALLVLAEACEPEQRPELLARARAASLTHANPYRALDVSLTSLRLGLGDPDHAGDDYVAFEQLSDLAEELSARRHVGLCLLAQAEVLAPHDLRGALDHARLGEAQLRVLGAKLEADHAGELIARLSLR